MFLSSKTYTFKNIRKRKQEFAPVSGTLAAKEVSILMAKQTLYDSFLAVLVAQCLGRISVCIWRRRK